MEKGADSEYKGNGEEVKRDDIMAAIYKISSSRMFALDIRPDIIDGEKFRYIWEVLDHNNIVWNKKIGFAKIKSNERRTR